MATRIPTKYAKVELGQIIGDRLALAFFFRNANGNFISWTGYTFTGVIYDAFGNIVTTCICNTVDAVPPGETESLADSKVEVTAVPANLPTKQGAYILHLSREEDADLTNVETVLQGKITFNRPSAEL